MRDVAAFGAWVLLTLVITTQVCIAQPPMTPQQLPELDLAEGAVPIGPIPLISPRRR